MKKISVLAVLFFVFVTLFAQDITYKTVQNISYYDIEICKSDEYINSRCKLDIYYPENKKDFTTVVWFHGGGLTGGEKEIPERLKNNGFCIVGVNYRLSPHVNVPKYIEDAAAAVAWVFKNINKYGGDTNKIIVSGYSAGGYLTLMLGLDKKWLAKHNIDANRIKELVPFSGQCITHFTIRKERGIPETQPIVDEYAPLFYVRVDAPKTLLITGDREFEMLGRYEENAYLYRMMKVVGHKDIRHYELDGYGHGMTEPAYPLLIKEIKDN